MSGNQLLIWSNLSIYHCLNCWSGNPHICQWYMHVWRVNPNVICWVSPSPWPKPTFPGVTLAGQHDQFVCGCILSFACKLDSHLSCLNHVKPLVGCFDFKAFTFFHAYNTQQNSQICGWFIYLLNMAVFHGYVKLAIQEKGARQAGREHEPRVAPGQARIRRVSRPRLYINWRLPAIGATRNHSF